MVEKNDVIIRRRHFNLSDSIERHKLRKFTRIFPSSEIASKSEYEFLISGLLSPEASAYDKSGVAQTIYEKIPNLLLG